MWLWLPSFVWWWDVRGVAGKRWDAGDSLQWQWWQLSLLWSLIVSHHYGCHIVATTWPLHLVFFLKWGRAVITWAIVEGDDVAHPLTCQLVFNICHPGWCAALSTYAIETACKAGWCSRWLVCGVGDSGWWGFCQLKGGDMGSCWPFGGTCSPLTSQPSLCLLLQRV